MGDRKKAKLSRNLLQMKFMKRTKEMVEKEEANEEAQNMFAKDITDAMRHFSNKYVVEKSFVPIENLVFGRFSYKGVNPEIEKIMAQNAPKKISNVEEDGVDVKASEVVARHLNSGTTGIAKKLTTKRNWRVMNDPHANASNSHSNNQRGNHHQSQRGHRGRNNRQFMKPTDD